MRTPQIKELGTLDAVESQPAVDVSYMYEFSKWVTIAGTFVATCHIESSNDGTNWVQEGANVTAAAVREITSRCKFLRIRCSAFTSGAAQGSVYGIQTLEG
jgi:hypothetical protein